MIVDYSFRGYRVFQFTYMVQCGLVSTLSTYAKRGEAFELCLKYFWVQIKKNGGGITLSTVDPAS